MLLVWVWLKQTNAALKELYFVGVLLVLLQRACRLNFWGSAYALWCTGPEGSRWWNDMKHSYRGYYSFSFLMFYGTSAFYIYNRYRWMQSKIYESIYGQRARNVSKSKSLIPRQPHSGTKNITLFNIFWMLEAAPKRRSPIGCQWLKTERRYLNFVEQALSLTIWAI